MGRDRHSNSRYPRPPSLEARACSNKPQTPYPRSYLAHNPSLCFALLLYARCLFTAVSFLVSPRFSFLPPPLLFVSFTCRNYHSSLFRDDSQHGDGSGVRSPAEVATTTQISFAPPWHRQAQSFHSNYSLVSRPSATCFRWFPPRNGGHTATSKLGYAEFQHSYLFRMLRVQLLGCQLLG